MALIALTTADTVDFVSVLDPDAVLEDRLVVEGDPTKGKKKVVVDWNDDASVFKVKALDVFLMGHIYDNASHLTGRQGSDDIGIKTRVNQTNIDAVRFGLAALPDNFKDRKGQIVSYKTNKEMVNGREYLAVDVSVLNTMGIRLISEMADKIKEISEVTADEEKNFAKESRPSG